jgi:hypothetical protein
LRRPWLQEIGLQQRWTNGDAPQEGTRLFPDGRSPANSLAQRSE